MQCMLDPVKQQKILLSLDLTETYLTSYEGLESQMGKQPQGPDLLAWSLPVGVQTATRFGLRWEHVADWSFPLSRPAEAREAHMDVLQAQAPAQNLFLRTRRSCDPVVLVHLKILSFSRNVAVVFHEPKVPKGLSQFLLTTTWCEAFLR